MKLPRVTALTLTALILTGCSSPTATPPSTTPTPDVVERSDVPWEDYAPEVKARIDEATDNADCATLNAEFQAAVENNDHVASTTDHNNADLMTYIDEASEIAGC